MEMEILNTLHVERYKDKTHEVTGRVEVTLTVDDLLEVIKQVSDDLEEVASEVGLLDVKWNLTGYRSSPSALVIKLYPADYDLAEDEPDEEDD